MNDIQFEFPRYRARALVGQKVDSTPCVVVSATCNSPVPFGTLVVYDDADALLCKLPTAKAHLDRPLGITLRQFLCDDYKSKSSLAAMRKGRVYVEADSVAAPGDAVYIKLSETGAARFSGDKKDSVQLKGAIFLEKCEGGLAPIEVNFFGGVQ